MIRIYNTLSQKKEEFKPIEPGKVGIYVCGMTVYDYCHLGHARVLVAFDVITRYLRHSGFDVNYVRNITDIDDKILRRADENGEVYTDLTERMIAAMHEDEARLGVLSPNAEPRATAFISDMIAMIETLIAGNHALSQVGVHLTVFIGAAQNLVVYVGDVAHVVHLKTTVAQISGDHIKRY